MKKPKVRVTVRRMMMAIALIGLAFFLVRGLGFASTVYSAGYS